MNKKNIIIAPSILTADFTNLGSTIKELENIGADYIHLDIMDGVFVPPITFGAKVAKDIKQITNLPLDAHLMVKNPQNHIESFANAGCSIISIHLEDNIHVHRILMSIKSYGVKAGIVINPHTAVSAIEPIIDYVDHILIMSVNPGYGGQEFIESTYKKIKDARDLIEKNNKNIHLAVDGGVNSKNIKRIIESGADFLIAGSAIVDAPNKQDAIDMLRNY